MAVDKFTLLEFESSLADCGTRWDKEFVKGEWQFKTDFSGGEIFVNSSIGVSEISDPAGANSIRVWGKYNNKYLDKSQRWVTRVIGWRERLKKVIQETRNMITDLDLNPKCPHCNSPMVIRAGVHGKFWGCTQFPKCRGTRNKPSKEEAKQLYERL